MKAKPAQEILDTPSDGVLADSLTQPAECQDPRGNENQPAFETDENISEQVKAVLSKPSPSIWEGAFNRNAESMSPDPKDGW